jgi:chemotaxis protein CheX
MDVEYINPFIAASVRVIQQVTGLSVNIGRIYTKSTPYQSNKILVIIGVTGSIHGNVVINLDKESACKVASGMMSTRVTELDELSKSAIAELCNMILGNTATIFSENNLLVDISPPTMLIGKQIELNAHNSVVICVPLLLQYGSKIELDISFSNNNNSNN